MVTASQVFCRAAYLIEEFGWQQEYAGSLSEGFCIMGAIWHARWELQYPDSNFKRNYLRELEPNIRGPLLQAVTPRLSSIPDFNDQPSRTKEEVINVLNQAALLAEERERGPQATPAMSHRKDSDLVLNNS